MITSVKNIGDIITFSKDLISEGVNFHPDDPFENDVNMETGEPSYSP